MKKKILLMALGCMAFFCSRAQYNMLEYAPGYPTVTVTPINQLISFPRARYKPIQTGSDSLLPLFSSMDPIYLGGLSQNQNYATSALNGAEINLYLARNFNWVLDVWQLGTGSQSSDTTTIQGKVIKNKIANPTLKMQGVTFLAQIGPHIPWDSHNYATEGTFPMPYFLQNNVPCPVNENGTPSPNCPTFPASGPPGVGVQARPSSVGKQAIWYPDDTLTKSGNYYLSSLNNFSTTLGGSLNFFLIWENGELFKRASSTAMLNDPGVSADMVTTGLNYSQYQSAWVERLMTGYKSKFIGTTTASTGTRFAEYQRQGVPGYFFDWAYTRNTFTSYRGKKLSTSDYYTTPNLWLTGGGATHGMLWMQAAQQSEFGAGDSIQSPFVSHGWDPVETQNVSPPQWLGLLKTLALSGAETYYPATFNLTATPTGDPNPYNYIWATVVPSYAQAITSRYERYLHYGKILPGDMMAVNVPTYPAFRFNFADARIYAVGRTLPGTQKFVFGGNLNRNSNVAGSTPDSVVRTGTIGGVPLTVTFHQHGNVYVFDNTTPAAPIFYQLDYWHEKTHPYYWSTDFILQAEVNDNYTDVQLKTTRRAGAGVGDFVNCTTYISYADTTTVLDTVRYNIQPTVAGTYYVWVRMRSRTGAATGVDMKLNGGTTISIPCVTDQNFYWYRFQNCVIAGNGISYSLTTAMQHLGILARNKFVEIDQIALTKTVNAGYPEPPAGCSTASVITPSGTTTFCTGGSVTLSATLASIYLWSTGETTRTIAVTTTGTFTATVTNSSGCTGVSAPLSVTVNTLPSTPTITASGSTTLCSGSNVTLTSSLSASYKWSTLATTPFINVSTAGTYTVTVTDANGCSAISAGTTVTVNAIPPVPTITAGGPTTFCNGGSVSLTATLSTSYLWSTGATTQAITASTTGSYRVTVTNAAGCTRSSALFPVTVNANPPTPTITTSGPLTFCSGDNVTLFASGGPPYLWSTGQTTMAITSFTASTYTVTVTNTAGCTASSPSVTTVINALPAVPTITPTGSTTFCSGGSVILTSSAGTTYQWSTGAITSAITTSTAGGYTVTISDANGCTRSSATTTVTVNGIPVIAPLAPVQNTCPAVTFDLATLTIVNSGTAITVLSYHATLSDAQNDINPIASTVNSTAVYYIRGETAAGCYAVASISVQITACACVSPPTANAGPDQTVCSGATVTLAGSRTVASTSRWTTSGTGTFNDNTLLAAIYTPSAADTVTGSVTLTLTTDSAAGGSCVSGVDAMIVTISARPAAVVTASGSTTFCTGGTINLVVTAATSYLWSTGATTMAIAVTSSGSYKATVTDVNGCTSGGSNTIAVSVNTLPAIPTITATGNVVFCTGDSVLLTATAATSYLWSNGTTTQTYYSKTSANYTVTVTNAAGCTRSSAVFSTTAIALPATPVITCIRDSICQGDSMQLKSSAATGNLWSTGAVTASIYVKTGGSYTVTVTNVSGCTKASVAKTIVVMALPSTPTITAGGNLAFCGGDSVSLTSSASILNVWSNGDTNQVIYAKTAGNYRVTVYNSFGCTASSAVTQVVIYNTPAKPVITTNKSPVLCYGNNVTLTSSRVNGNTWSTGATSQSITTELQGTYIVTVTTPNGCTNVSDPLDVTVINCQNTCQIVTKMTVGQITRTAVNMRWDTLNVATDYLIFLTNLRTNVTTRTTVQGNNHFIKMKGLDPGTGYSWRIQAVCGCCVFTPYSIVKYFATKE